MFEKFSRSWSLIKYSAGVLRQDRELLVFPLLSTIAAILVALTFVPMLMQTGIATEDAVVQTFGVTRKACEQEIMDREIDFLVASYN